MTKRPLGNTGIEVSELAFGGVEIGIPYGINIKSTADMLNKTESINLLHAALDNGVNFFDTARMYGKSETIIGEAFKSRRSEVVIGTKCRRLRDDDGSIPDYSKLKNIIETSLTVSLRELQTGYADIYMLHPALSKVEVHVKKYGELLEKTGFDLSTLAVKFALSYPEVSSVLVGIDHPVYLQKSIDAVNGKYLDEIKLSRAEELNFPDLEFLNLPYWDKMNWLT